MKKLIILRNFNFFISERLKKLIILSILFLLIYSVYSFQYISENKLCITDKLHNLTCLNKYDNYSLNSDFYYFSSYDKEYSLNLITEKGKMDFDEILIKIGEFCLALFIGFLFIKFISR